MKKIIAVSNQKGGVGKTTSCVNIAASFTLAKRRVLLIDLDPQGNATMGSGIDKYSLTQAVDQVLLADRPIKEIICQTDYYDLLPANDHLAMAEMQLVTMAMAKKRLKRALADCIDDYDIVFIDCPPSLNMLTINALVAASSVIIPVQCEYYALEGLSSLLATIKEIQSSLNPNLSIEGILQTLYDGRNRLSQEVSEQLKQHFGDYLYHTVVPRNVRLAEAPSHGMTIYQYDKTSKGAAAYLALTGEMLRRFEEHFDE